MRKSKGIVLFITLMFILAISVMVTKNLNDTNSYIDLSNSETYYVKSLITLDNLQQEFLNYFFKNKENLDSLLSEESFQKGMKLSYGDVHATVYFKEYTQIYNLNLLARNDAVFNKELAQFFSDNNVLEFERFKQWVIGKVNQYGEITSFEQIDLLVDEFAKVNRYNEIRILVDKFTFFDIKQKSVILGNIIVNHDNKVAQSDFIYDITSKKIEGLSIAFQ